MNVAQVKQAIIDDVESLRKENSENTFLDRGRAETLEVRAKTLAILATTLQNITYIEPRHESSKTWY